MANLWRWIALGLLLACQTELAVAAPPCDKLVPAGALGFFTLTNSKDSINGWNQTHLGQLFAIAEMQPFLEDLRDQIRNRWNKNKRQWGINWNNFQQLVVGEACLAVTRDAQGGDSVIVLFDIGPNAADALAEMVQLDNSMKGNGAKTTQMQAGGVTVTIHTLPGRAPLKGRPAPDPDQLCHFIKEGVLGISTDPRLAAEVLGRWGAAAGSLASTAPYVQCMQKCQAEAGNMKPSLRWFLRPIDLAEALRTDAIRSGDMEEPAIDRIAVLKKQGFSAVQGIGGYHNLAADTDTSVLYRVAIYAPGPLQLGARVLGFPNGPAVAPEDWVPQNLSTYATFNWDLNTAFDAAGSIVDEVMEEKGYFKDLMRQIAEEEDGPKIDPVKDILAHLGTRVIVVSDFIKPFDGNSQRMLVGVQCKSPQAAQTLAANLKRGFENDATVKARAYNGVQIWEFHEREKKTKRPIRPVKGPNKAAPPKAAVPAGPPPALAVYHGYVLIATRVGLLEKVLDKQPATLAKDADYKRVEARVLAMAGGQPVSFMAYENQANDLQPTYELFKAGRLREDNTPIGRVLARITAEDRADKIQIKGDKLPDFDRHVRPFFGPTGWFVKTTADGWMLTGFSFVK